MSLLEQALKKAERAKLNGAHDGEAEPRTTAPALTLAERNDAPAASALSLSPLNGAPPPGFGEPAPDPAGATRAPQPEPPSGRWNDEPAPEAAPRGPARPGIEPGGDKTAPAPDWTRLAILAGVLSLVVAGLGYRYWQAVNGPGAGANLPMVPMPPPGAAAPPAQLPAQLPTPSPPAPEQEEVFGAPAVPVSPSPAAGPAQTAPPAATATTAAPTTTPTPTPMPMPDSERPRAGQRRHGPDPGWAPPPAAPETAAAPARADAAADIHVTRGAAAPQMNPALQGAYQALNGGDDAGARRQYEAVLRQEPNNRDALLGLAAVALREDAPQRAAALYQRLLELDPQDADALAGLSGLRQGDPGRDELGLKAQLRRAPGSGPLLFALGNLYARQGRWPEAQQAYFGAAGAAPANPDYAFNLAVGLDRLNQGKLALDYYRRALELARATPAAFAPDGARRRIAELAAASAAPSASAP